MEPPAKRPNLDRPDVAQEAKQKSQAKSQKELVENILTYDVLRVIFKHLSAKELTNAAHLCRTWRDAANEELATRKTPESYCKHYKVDNTEDSEYAGSLGNQLKIKPAFAFVCAKMQQENEWPVVDCYCSNLPKSCSTIQMGGYEVIENESEIDCRVGVAVSAFLPQMHGLTHKVYQIQKSFFKHSTDMDIRSHAGKTVNKLLPPDLQSGNEKRCIILLANQRGYKFNKLVLKGIQEKYKPGTISLWGGVCVDLKLCDNPDFHRCSQLVDWTGMYLSSPSLESYSLVMSQSCRLEAQMTEKLEKFRKNIELKKYSLGFMFACIERVKRKNLEIKTFKKVFPQVPLVGLHGDGEYGLNTLNTKRESELHHSYTTIFLILTYT